MHTSSLSTPSLRLMLSLSLMLMLSACAGRDYVLTEPDAMGIVPETSLLAEYKVDQAWWKAYNDPQLNSLVELALERNIDLAKSALTVSKAYYQARQAGADLVPTPSGSLGAGATANTKRGSTNRSWDTSLNVSYEIDLWQRMQDTASAQEWEYRASTEDRESARQALINSVVDAYFNLLYLRQSLEVTSRSFEFYKQLGNIIDIRYNAGKVDGLEPITARQSLLAAQNSITDLHTQIRNAEQTLRDLLNLPPDAALPLPSTFDLLAVTLPSIDLNVPVAALSLRPDVKAAEYRILKSFRNQSAAQSSLYPSITIGTSLNVSSDSAGTLFDIPLLGGTIKINLPFLQWNKLRWNIRSSEADFETARLNFTQTVTTALNELDTFYFSYANTLSLLDNLLKKHEADAQISAYREQRYQLGADELKNWLEARRTENDSMISALKAKYDTIRYENAVFKALGGRLMPK